jgi:hypothetical protein
MPINLLESLQTMEASVLQNVLQLLLTQDDRQLNLYIQGNEDHPGSGKQPSTYQDAQGSNKERLQKLDQILQLKHSFVSKSGRQALHQ